MRKTDLIEQRQYAETVLAGLNIRPFKIDLAQGLLMVPGDKVKLVRKICKSFDWPLVVSRLQ
jgi:hypothetical protein|tara:strand:+ start:953 stop:1138 length:186 start_codon:yes stop_codon:yes gene_type:complete